MTNDEPRDLADLVRRLDLGRGDRSGLTDAELERAALTLSEVVAAPKHASGRRPRRVYVRRLVVGVAASVALVLSLVLVRGLPDQASAPAVVSVAPVVTGGSGGPAASELRSLAAAASLSPDSDVRAVEVSTWAVGDTGPQTQEMRLLSQDSVSNVDLGWERTTSGFLIPRTAGSPVGSGSQDSDPGLVPIVPAPVDTPMLVRSYLAAAGGCGPASVTCLLSGVEVMSLRQDLPPQARELMWQALALEGDRLVSHGLVRDRAGRSVVAVSGSGEGREVVVFVDPASARFLGRDTVVDGAVSDYVTVLSGRSPPSS